MSGGTRSYEMAVRLVQMGHHVTVLTSDRDASLWRSIFGFSRTTIEDGIRVVWVPASYTNKYGFLLRCLAFLVFAIRSVFASLRLRSDLVFATSTPLTVILPGYISSRFFGVPLVFEVRDLWPEMPIAVGAVRNPLLISFLRWLELFSYRASAAVVALSPGMRDGVVARGYDADRVVVIPNCCDFDVFSGSASSKCHDIYVDLPQLVGRPMVVYAGTIGEINGVDYLVFLASAVRKIDPNVVFLIIGDGIKAGEVRALAVNEGVLGVNLFMLPPVSKAIVPDYLRLAVAVACLFRDIPAMRVNSANKFFDCLASGRPCLLNYSGWHADLVQEFRCGLVVGSDIPVAANALVEFIADSVNVSVSGSNASSLGRSMFDRDVQAKRLESTFLRVLAGEAKGVSELSPEYI